MRSKLFVMAGFGLFSTICAWAQSQPAKSETVPIYRVTVVERTVKAVNYQYRGGPTPIDFRGTVLLPHAKGDAMVESKAGRTEIDARFEHVEAPSRYGPEYLTYVLWAITPDGHAKNLGEVLPGSSDHAHLRVTTDLQTFGMIVTAEPYSAVRQPSDVVVMQNEVRSDTTGRIELIQAKYELLPRGHYTYNVPAPLRPDQVQGEKLSMSQYESLLEVYQALNAVQIARSLGADHYAPDTFAKAERELRTAQSYQAQKLDRTTVVSAARQAAQSAEDARTITIKRKQEDELAQAREQVAHEQELRARAEADAKRLQQQASADRQQLEEERSRLRVESGVTAIPSQATVAVQGPPPPPPPPANLDASRAAVRSRLLQDVSAGLPVRDTPRGILVTVPDGDFRGALVNPGVYSSISRIAAVVAAHPGLSVEVEGHTSSGGSESHEEDFSYQRAVAVRDSLVRSGVPSGAITARGLGSSRPLVSNSSASGKEQNRRVEITISGDPIGTVPTWDQTYSVAPRR